MTNVQVNDRAEVRVSDSGADPVVGRGDRGASVGHTVSRAEVGRRRMMNSLVVVGLIAAMVVITVVAVGYGKLSIPPLTVARILWHDLMVYVGADSLAGYADWTMGERSAVTLIRAPRAILAVLVGGALAVSGAALQALFRNPLVSPDVIGVSSGAAFGGVLAILIGASSTVLITGSFLSGLVAALIVMLMGRIRTSNPILTIVLGGIVVAAFFNALVSLITYLADTYETLPSITFWLMGSFTAATWQKVLVALVPVVIGFGVVMALRWRINVLAMGDEDARALGINPGRLRVVLITAVALLTSVTVAVAGIIGWVGLVVPHLIRLVVGPDNRVVLPASFFAGGAYVVLVDTIARSLGQAEIPVGILTAMIGAPVFIGLLLHKARRGGSIA